jgi:hypothetical protein
MPFTDAGILIASPSGSEVEFTNGDQAGVRPTKTAAAQSAQTASASNPTIPAKTARRNTAKAD